MDIFNDYFIMTKFLKLLLFNFSCARSAHSGRRQRTKASDQSPQVAKTAVPQAKSWYVKLYFIILYNSGLRGTGLE